MPIRATRSRPRASVLEPDAIDRGLDGLETIGLVRGPDGVRAAAAVTTSLGEFPAGLGPPGTLSGRPLRTALDRASEDGRALLERLSQGQPRGLVTPDSGTATVVEDLVAAGLLIRSDPHTVLLPLQVCLALRGDHPLGPVHPELPTTKPTRPGVARVDGTAGGQALAAVALARRLLDVLGTSPAQALKSGGVGVRELRRVARHADAPEAVVALHLELLSAAELISPSDVRARYPVSHWTPTEAADAFHDEAEENAWATLARQWLDLRTDPARVGSRDSGDKVVNALSFELAWARGPADRRFVLAELSELPPGSGLTPTDLRERLAWRGPLRMAERVEALSETVVSEATALGLVAFDALSTAGRILFDDPDEAAAALVASLPDPVDEFLVQADLTVIAPGRLSRDLARRLGQVADIESSGSATVYRVTPDSLRRGLRRRAGRGRDPRAVPEPLPYPGPAGPDLSDRRRGPPARSPADRLRLRLPAQRRHHPDRRGRGRGQGGRTFGAPAGADGGGLAGQGRGSARSAAGRGAGARGRGRPRRRDHADPAQPPDQGPQRSCSAVAGTAGTDPGSGGRPGRPDARGRFRRRA